MQVIETLNTKTFTRSVQDTDKYTYRPDRPLKVLQRMCFYVLGRLGCYSSSQHDYVKHYHVDEMSLMDKIFKQENDVFRMSNYEPSVVYIGREDYMEMMKTEIPNQYMNMHANARLMDNGYEKIKGMNLIIVPWMKGVLVAPAVKN